MGFHNPPIKWSELERALSDTRRPRQMPANADGGDSPAWSLRRGPYVPQNIVRDPDALPYAELHAHSSYSFLDGASSPEELLEEAERLGLHALAITDHDGFYGIVRFAEAAETASVKTVFGAELSLGLTEPQNGEADPEGNHLLVLARQEEGYHRLAKAITEGQLRGAEKGRPVYDLDELAAHAGGHWVVLTGCRKGAVRQALADGDPGVELDRLVSLFGRDNVYVELIDHGNPLDTDHNDALAALATERGLPLIASGNVHYASPAQRHLATAVAAVRASRSLDELDGWLPPAGTAHLRSGREMRARFARYPGAVERTVTLADELAFPLRRAKPDLPKQQVPDGHTPMSYLRKLVWDAVPAKYPDLTEADRERIEAELAVIETKDFPGYFLIVHDIVAFARSQGILCQGRGSAANSAVCYLLNITAVDSIFYKLPFERFLSSLRDEEPDIDVDFDSDRREEVIQWVFEKYGRRNAAQVANVIQYRPKNAVRDMAKALGHSPGQQDAWSKQVERWGAELSTGDDTDIPAGVIDLSMQLLKAPRHLGIHSGGMVLTDRPVGEVVPIAAVTPDGSLGGDPRTDPGLPGPGVGSGTADAALVAGGRVPALVASVLAIPGVAPLVAYQLNWKGENFYTGNNVAIFISSGAPLRWLDTPESWDAMRESWEGIFQAAEVSTGDRVMFAFSFGPFLGFWLAFEAAARLLERCLQGDGSLLTDDAALWTIGNLEKIHKVFVAAPDEGDRSFTEKFKDQIKPAGPETCRLAAEVLAVYFLFPSNVGAARKKELVGEVLGWADETFPSEGLMAEALSQGIGSGGQGYNTRRPFEIAFLIEFAIAWKRLSEAEVFD